MKSVVDDLFIIVIILFTLSCVKRKYLVKKMDVTGLIIPNSNDFETPSLLCCNMVMLYISRPYHTAYLKSVEHCLHLCLMFVVISLVHWIHVNTTSMYKM